MGGRRPKMGARPPKLPDLPRKLPARAPKLPATTPKLPARTPKMGATQSNLPFECHLKVTLACEEPLGNTPCAGGLIPIRPGLVRPLFFSTAPSAGTDGPNDLLARHARRGAGDIQRRTFRLRGANHKAAAVASADTDFSGARRLVEKCRETLSRFRELVSLHTAPITSIDIFEIDCRLRSLTIAPLMRRHQSVYDGTPRVGRRRTGADKNSALLVTQPLDPGQPNSMCSGSTT
jgi:hypothetical protein